MCATQQRTKVSPAPATAGEQTKNILLLALGWGCAVGALFITVSSGTAAASGIQSTAAPDGIPSKDTGTATVPIGVVAACATVAALCAQLLTRLFPRRVVLCSASALGALGAALLCVAVHIRSFPLMVVSGAPQGIAYGTSNLYRFLAVEFTRPETRELALAAVVGGAVLAAFIGPEASRHIRFRLGTDYLAAFILAAGLWVVQFLCVLSVDYTVAERLPAPSSASAAPETAPATADATAAARSEQRDLEGQQLRAAPTKHGTDDEKVADLEATQADTLARPWRTVLLQPSFLLAALISAFSFFISAGLMAATPLAMATAGHTVDDSTLVAEAHIVAMHLPSLLSGSLVRRLSPEVMGVFGTLALVGGILHLFVSVARPVFWAALILIGVGWNLSYVSASALTVQLLRPPERLVGQGVFDALSLSGLSIAMMSASFTFDGLGWHTMCLVYLGLSAPIVLAALVLLGGKLRHACRQQS